MHSLQDIELNLFACARRVHGLVGEPIQNCGGACAEKNREKENHLGRFHSAFSLAPNFRWTRLKTSVNFRASFEKSKFLTVDSNLEIPFDSALFVNQGVAP